MDSGGNDLLLIWDHADQPGIAIIHHTIASKDRNEPSSLHQGPCRTIKSRRKELNQHKRQQSSR
jgi:hypothetical protein